MVKMMTLDAPTLVAIGGVITALGVAAERVIRALQERRNHDPPPPKRKSVR